MRRLALVLLLFTLGCGSSPTPVAPTPTPTPTPTPVPAPTPAPAPALADIGGTWTGRMNLVYKGQSGFFDTRAILQQSGGSVSGEWVVTGPVANDAKGDVSGTVTLVGATTMIAGTVTWSTEIGTGTGRCLGRSAFSGTATTTRIRWTSAGVDFSPVCTNDITDLDWALAR